MKRFLVFQVVACFLAAGAAHAQTENWDTYMAKFGNKPGSVMVDLALIDRAPNKLYPYLLITGPRAHRCDTQNLPAKDEIDQLEDILATTTNFITGVAPRLLAGTFTYDCERLNYYYIKDTIGIRTAIMRMYDRNYKDYSFAINMKYDPAWLTYRTFLYPDDATQSWMDDTKTISQMMAQGDSLTAQRNINFDFYFTTDTARAAFADFATAHSYKAGKLPQTTANAPFRIVITKADYVRPEIIQKIATALKTEAQKHGGKYSGWNARK